MLDSMDPFYSDQSWFYTIVVTILNLYQYVILLCFVVNFSIILEFMARGCNFKRTTREEIGILARAFDPFKFKEHTECVICLGEYDRDSMVTVLPCDVRHYFHANCIEEWSSRNNTCPLCKAPFTIESIREFNRRLTFSVAEREQ